MMTAWTQTMTTAWTQTIAAWTQTMMTAWKQTMMTAWTHNDDSLDTDKTMKWIVWDRNENATAQEQTITRLYLA